MKKNRYITKLLQIDDKLKELLKFELKNLRDIRDDLSLYVKNILKDNKRSEKFKRKLTKIINNMANTKDSSKIDDLENEFNNYISEMQKNIFQNELIEYHNKSDKMRKIISKYKSFLEEREKFKNYYDSIDNLKKEEIRDFKKILNNELKHIKKETKNIYNNNITETVNEVKNVEEENQSKKDTKHFIVKFSTIATAGIVTASTLFSAFSDKLHKQNNDIKHVGNVKEKVVKEVSKEEVKEETKKIISDKKLTSTKKKKIQTIDETKVIDDYYNLINYYLINSEPSIEDKEMYLLEYFNMENKDYLNRFTGAFIRNMERYNISYTEDDIINIFYDVANINIEDKIEYIKDYYNLSDIQVEEVIATYVAEGYGGGQKYEDVYAVTTTGINRTQFNDWMNVTEYYFGKGTGDNIYYATANKNQFVAYQSHNYYEFLSKLTLEGSKACVDALYINLNNNLYMHDYTEFRSPNNSYLNRVAVKEQLAEKGNVFLNECDATSRLTNTNNLTLTRKI